MLISSQTNDAIKGYHLAKMFVIVIYFFSHMACVARNSWISSEVLSNGWLSDTITTWYNLENENHVYHSAALHLCSWYIFDRDFIASKF